jgi:hypothetical protein
MPTEYSKLWVTNGASFPIRVNGIPVEPTQTRTYVLFSLPIRATGAVDSIELQIDGEHVDNEPIPDNPLTISVCVPTLMSVEIKPADNFGNAYRISITVTCSLSPGEGVRCGDDVD